MVMRDSMPHWAVVWAVARSSESKLPGKSGGMLCKGASICMSAMTASSVEKYLETQNRRLAS